jgi:RNA polymerase sigma factor (sigma-70 family)
MKQKSLAASEERNREMFFSMMGQHLKRLYRFVRQEIGYFESVGDLVPGELTPGDVVDAMLVRAYREFITEPARRNLRGWLIRLAREQLERDVKGLWAARENSVHIEEDIPETPPQEEVSTLGEEILYYYEPEEDLKLEDAIPDVTVPTPEQVVEAKELRACVREALNRMPRDWRRALLLHHVERLEGAELAEAVGRQEPEMERMVEQARDYLREQLVEAGCHFTTAA